MKQSEGERNHPEVQKIFEQQSRETNIRVDRGFSILLLIQWVASIVVGILVTPSTWVGSFSGAIENALVGLIFGGLFSLPAVYCVHVFPGERFTRYLVAASQMFFSVLFIYLAGGRIESHFHVFVSLAALAFYKDVGVLGLASFIVIADHILRGCLLPLSLYGQEEHAQWRWIEHTMWIILADIILIIGIERTRFELQEVAHSKFQLMKAREEALQLSSIKSTFLSNMSHEIRTPLNSIIGFADILRDTPLDDEQQGYVGTIHRCSDSLLHLINDVLDISKIENGLLQIDRHRFDIKELHKDIHRIFAAKCQEKGLQLRVDVDESIPHFALGDSHRLRQVLMNLVGNAVKFTDQGSVHVSLHRDPVVESRYHWAVRDTGRGIRKENMGKLFRSFAQEDASVSRTHGGSGLGLMICKNLVELMGGNIVVDSKLGEGTVFSFTLPLDEV
ncbi:ATP-binding protein [Bdellovibrio sp.]|uniref:sensor histidine kinase n=1 Tax=Bdellovibrio TaxID=958 RepID=UPI003221825D